MDREVTKHSSARVRLCKADNNIPRSGFLSVSSFCIYSRIPVPFMGVREEGVFMEADVSKRRGTER